jgi:D-alanyl-lipoteichoic acid acyltransferase DltB (MBOAT superfamily)
MRLTVAAKGFLVFTSLFFYSYWNIVYLPLILGSILFNFMVGSGLSKETKFSKKSVLVFGIIANVALLGYFKYSDFFITNFNLSTGLHVSLLHLILPLGISFFTFTQIAFLVDSYKGKVKEYDFLNYALFVTFFPHLLAGPIVHHADMMPQFASRWNMAIRYRNVAAGLFLFSIGLFKKVVIADTFATWANNGFDVATSLNLLEAWATSLSYTFQLYFDFSGYTDMAIGVSLMLNIKLPANFNSPYKARDIQDFWRRWHITLSKFLRDYIYIPLGGNQVSFYRNYFNLFSVFLIGGLWHGASWMFVLWGALHGVAMVTHRIWKDMGFKMNALLAWFITFNFINITWVFFRAKQWDDALKVLGGMFSLNNLMLPDKLATKLSFLSSYGVVFGQITEHIGDGSKVLNYLLLGFVLLLYFKNSMQKLESFKLNAFHLIFSISILLTALSVQNSVSEFLYFNF